jgi:hypothetical protein
VTDDVVLVRRGAEDDDAVQLTVLARTTALLRDDTAFSAVRDRFHAGWCIATGRSGSAACRVVISSKAATVR